MCFVDAIDHFALTSWFRFFLLFFLWSSADPFSIEIKKSDLLKPFVNLWLCIIFRNRQSLRSLMFITHMFLIFDKNNCLSSLLDIRLIWCRILATKYSYEYFENSILTIDNRIDWFFRFDVLETIYDEEILHYKMSRSSSDRYIHFEFAASWDSTKSIDSNHF